jgi:type VI secretion system protein ImpE
LLVNEEGSTLSSLGKFVADGTLAEKLAAAQEKVRQAPSEAAPRVYLFQLQAVLGLWEKALIQLQAAASFDPGAMPMAQIYREAVRAEVFRDEVFSGKRLPRILGEPKDWMGGLVESLKRVASGEFEAADSLRADALEKVEAAGGKIDGVQFEWLADADSRLGPVFEVIVNGQYFWVAQDSLAEIKIDAPVDLRDTVWAVCKLRLKNDGEQAALMPVRYPVNRTQSDALLLARMTEWMNPGMDTWCGQGQRMFTSESGDHALLDTRSISFDQAQ